MTPQIKQRIEQIRCGEVPEGYKKTKVGIVPSEWRETPVDKCVIEYVEKTTVENQYPLLTSARSGLMLQSEYYSNNQVTTNANIGYNVLPRGYVTYRSRSDDGKFRFNENQIIDRGIISYFYPVFSFNPKVSHKFMLCLLNHTIYRQSYSFVEGTAQQVLSFKKLGSLKYCLPSLPEQEKIAEILSVQDKLIELKEKLLEEKKRQKKYLMQQLFQTGKWKMEKLSDLAEIDTGDADTQDKKTEGQYPFFVRSAVVERIDNFSYDGEAILTPGDGKIGEIFHYYVGKFNFHQRVYKISDFRGCSGKFIYYYLQLFFKKRAYSMTAKATVDSLRRDMLTDMPIFLPSLAEQERIVSVLNDADKEIALLQQELDQEKQKKKALMQLLLTGIVRVNA